MIEQSIAVIRKEGNKFVIYSKKGKKIGGPYDSREAAEKRLKQIEYFKHSKSERQMSRQTDADALAQTLSKVNVKDTKKLPKPESLPDDPAGGRTKTELAGAGTVAGVVSSKVIDGKSHFPVDSENRARSAVSRVMRLRQTPDWFMGTLAELVDLVKSGVSNRHPTLSVSVAMKYDRVLGSFADRVQGEEVKTGTIQNPGNANPKKVPQVPTPSLKAISAAEKLLANPTVLQSFAKELPAKIEEQIARLKEAKTLAERLMKDGLTGEEFQALFAFLQEDILHELMMLGTKGSEG